MTNKHIFEQQIIPDMIEVSSIKRDLQNNTEEVDVGEPQTTDPVGSSEETPEVEN